MDEMVRGHHHLHWAESEGGELRSTSPTFRRLPDGGGGGPARCEHGSVDPTVDTDDLFDLLLGVVLTRTLLGHVIPRHAPVERTVELLIRAVRPLT